MHVQAPERILRRSERACEGAAALRFGPIDFSRPFFHERATQLYHTPWYETLTPAQRLRYNQLFGVRSNEQFMMFEHGFTGRVIARLAAHPTLRPHPVLRRCLHLMLREEARHQAMFRDLNRACLPQAYAHGDVYFTRLGALEQLALRVLERLPHQLMSLVWLILILEEHSIRVSLDMIRRPVTESLGPLEPNIVRAHTVHLRDEARHVHIDANLIDLLAEHGGALKRRVNAALLGRLLREILTPKRSGLRVIRYLVQEFPDLAPQREAMLAAVRAQGLDPLVLGHLLDPAQMPLTALLGQRYPEFGSACALQPARRASSA